MRTNAGRLIVTLLITAVPTIPAFGQSPRGTGFVRILLPVAIQGEVFGALGSRWTTRVAITNSAAAPVDILGYDWSAYGCVNVCAEPPLTPPGVTFFPLVVPGTRTQGAILLVEPSHASDVDIDLRIQDVSRQSQTWGTELPVIAESGLFQRPFQMLNIPLGSDFRDMLRLYDVDAHEGATVRLRFLRSTRTPSCRSSLPGRNLSWTSRF